MVYSEKHLNTKFFADMEGLGYCDLGEWIPYTIFRNIIVQENSNNFAMYMYILMSQNKPCDQKK